MIHYNDNFWVKCITDMPAEYDGDHSFKIGELYFVTYCYRSDKTDNLYFTFDGLKGEYYDGDFEDLPHDQQPASPAHLKKDK